MRFQTKQIPNILTIFRITLVPIIVVLMLVPGNITLYQFQFLNVDYCFTLNYFIAGVFFVIACLTDLLDGYLARRNSWVSDFGKLWDPVADKLLINAVIICFAVKDSTFVWVPIIMISRDVIVDALRIQAIGKKQDIAANIFGKLKTVCQMVAIIVIFFLLNGTFQKEHSINYCLLQNLFMYFALITSVLSGIIYFSQYYLGKNK